MHPYVEWHGDSARMVVRGTTLPVTRLWAWHRKGVTCETLVKRYPKLGAAKVLGTLAWCYDNHEQVEEMLTAEVTAS